MTSVAQSNHDLVVVGYSTINIISIDVKNSQVFGLICIHLLIRELLYHYMTNITLQMVT